MLTSALQWKGSEEVIPWDHLFICEVNRFFDLTSSFVIYQHIANKGPLTNYIKGQIISEHFFFWPRILPKKKRKHVAY